MDDRVFRGTGMKMMLTLESLTSQCDLCLADLCQGEKLEWGTKQKLKEEAGNIQGDSEKFLETF